MRDTVLSMVPDLSLQISLPSCISKSDQFKEAIRFDSTTDSGSSASVGSDLSHENNGYFHLDKIKPFNLPLVPSYEPTLSLGFGQVPTGTNVHHHNHHHHHHQYQHYQPQIYGRDFKRSSRMNISGVKRTARAPRMRWTSTLHAHFVHAVQLLGGHEPKGQGENVFVNQHKGINNIGEYEKSGEEIDAVSQSSTMPQNMAHNMRDPSSFMPDQTNAWSHSNRDRPFANYPHIYSKMGGIETANNSSSNDTLVNLEFTLGRPSWKMEQAGSSSNDLTLLKC
ncbi:hypothetical protein CQW23_33195 [Capsicum baccatum]|uniref:Transcription factor KAN4 n=1 Tax=Capsicum baccatum TaxID=33114 RepID=A0A2G2V2J1_CAPBA|nr:hypothetical protein CQW23_33195 [Capsicum baccatum]